MAEAYASWGGSAGAMARAVDRAVGCARVAEADGFDEALAELERSDVDQLAVLLGTLTQDLLERAFPDGLDSDDVEQALRRCLAASRWYVGLDENALVRALTGTLGFAEPDNAPPIAGGLVVAHGLLLITELLTSARTELAPVLESALGELRRAQTMELP